LALAALDLTKMTIQELTLLFLCVVVSLGIAFVWMLWEMEQITRARLARVHRNRDRGLGS